MRQRANTVWVAFEPIARSSTLKDGGIEVRCMDPDEHGDGSAKKNRTIRRRTASWRSGLPLRGYALNLTQ